MNKYEKAIRFLEDAIRESDEIMACCSPVLQTELTEQSSYFEAAISAMRRIQPMQEALEFLAKRTCCGCEGCPIEEDCFASDFDCDQEIAKRTLAIGEEREQNGTDIPI